MPTLEEKPIGSPTLPAITVTSPRVLSPGIPKSPSKGQSVTGDPNQLSQEDGAGFVTQLSETVLQEDSTSRKPESSIGEPETSIFLTETLHEELADIKEEDFEDRTGEDEDPYKDLDDMEGSRRTPGSQVSSLTEESEAEADYDTDLDMEPDKWLHPELFDRDTTGKNRYLRMCDNLNIQPITYFVKHMQDTELVMKYHGLGPLGVKAMSDPLEINTTIEKMDLEGNYILGVGATYLSKVLKDNVYVTELILSENKIGNMGAKAVCDLLMENKTITYVDLKGNEIEDPVAENFYDMLTKNTDLKTLILRHNCFEDAGAVLFKDAMAENDTLETLDLSWNHFQWRGCVTIAEGLQENSGIKYCNVCMNGFGLKGAEALEDALRNNHTLLELNISYCRIPLEGAPHIAAGLQKNDCLEELNIGYNPLQGEGGFCILVAAERNENDSLKYLNFGNLMVKKEFQRLADELESDKNMSVLYGGVMLDVTRFRNANWDPWSAMVNDPMTKLKAWLDKAGYRLVDLLLTFDRDMSLSLDLQELKAGIRRAEIDLTDAEIEILMNNLDKDGSGEVDMSELMEGDLENTLLQREANKFKEEQDKEDKERRKMMREGDVKGFQKLIQESDVIKPTAVPP